MTRNRSTDQGYRRDASENPLDWYTLTETANSILDELIAYFEWDFEHP